MCKFDYSLGNNKDDFISRKFDDSYIKNFYIKKCITEVLKDIEQELKEKLAHCDNIKCYLKRFKGQTDTYNHTTINYYTLDKINIHEYIEY